MAGSSTVEEYVTALPEHQRRIADRLVPLVREVPPGTGAVRHGHPVWSPGPTPGNSPICCPKAHCAHLTLGFRQGRELPDPSGRPRPGPWAMAGVRLTSPEEVEAELFTDRPRRARELAGATTG